jgi:hypothetical protein
MQISYVEILFSLNSIFNFDIRLLRVTCEVIFTGRVVSQWTQGRVTTRPGKKYAGHYKHFFNLCPKKKIQKLMMQLET